MDMKERLPYKGMKDGLYIETGCGYSYLGIMTHSDIGTSNNKDDISID
jgi:hypothetical protein